MESNVDGGAVFVMLCSLLLWGDYIDKLTRGEAFDGLGTEVQQTFRGNSNIHLKVPKR